MEERTPRGPRRLWVGGRTTEEEPALQGVSVRRVDGTSVSSVERLAPLRDPTWVLPHPGGRTVLAVLEEDQGALAGSLWTRASPSW